MISISDYKTNTKEFRLEEPFDFLLYRPIAYVIVKLSYHLPLRPDHFSILALISSIISFYYLSSGSYFGLTIGGLFILVFSVFDCCDGMLARAKGNSSKFGKQIDMFVDLLANILFYTGLFIGLKKSKDIFPIHYFTYLAAICIFIHATFYYFYKRRYDDHLHKDPNRSYNEVKYYQREYNKLKGTNHIFQKTLLRLFLIFSSGQPKNTLRFNHETYVQQNKNILPLWALIAGSTHLTILSLSLIIHKIGLYFYYALVLANIWVVFMLIVQYGVNHNLRANK